MQHNIGLFIFRRDLRIIDNTALDEATKKCKKIYPIFIFTPDQVSNKNDYKSSNSIQFMIKSLDEVDKELRKRKSQLHYFYGDNDKVIKKLIRELNVNAIYFNKDYTPYSLKRDKMISKICSKNKVECNTYDDVILIEDFNKVLSNSGTKYYFFTHFRNKAKKLTVRKPNKKYPKNLSKIVSDQKYQITDPSKFLINKKFYIKNKYIRVTGGRKEGKKILKNIKDFKSYDKTRNTPSKPTTTLSAHNHFGTVSIREVYYEFKEKLKNNSPLIDQLYWRDFYYYLGDHHPDMFNGKPIPAKKKYNKIKWKHNTSWFNKWKNGKTGFPIVDAGMREMNKTGFMHNRVRMIVSMFLIKGLIIDWRKGEKYFSQKLVDIDRTQNVGNWMWSASTGADGQPWLRIFNPWSQGKRADPSGDYIKKWIPELDNVDGKDLHKWDKKYIDYPKIDYPKPIVDHATQRELALKAYGDD